MRFDAHNQLTPVEIVKAENSAVDSVIDISRGGIAVTHHKGLKVGDVFPVEIECGDLQVNADVKVVTATDRRAGAEFINLDEAAANKILYMNLLLEATSGALSLNE